MNRRNGFLVCIGLLTLAGVTVFAPAAHAGPPLICWPFDIGNAQSLPWGAGGWNAPRNNYALASLSRDTLALLAPGTPVIVRMETLRRATIYASKDPRVADELLSLLKARAMEAEGAGRADALAWFDAGYLAEAYKQMAMSRPHSGMSPTLDGYAWVNKAIQMRGGDPEMEFAAALIASRASMQASRDAHLRKAVAGAPDGSLLAINLVTHCPVFGLRAAALADLRTQFASTP